jgi:hypothetical protein
MGRFRHYEVYAMKRPMAGGMQWLLYRRTMTCRRLRGDGVIIGIEE